MRKSLLASTVAIAALAVPLTAVAAAQDPAPQQAPPGEMADIVVTAQKRSENLQKVPIAIIAASAEQLEHAGITSSMQLNTVAPGLNIRTTVGSFQPSIRGIGTSASVVENPVALYVDGVYYPQQKEGVRVFNDIAQVAVLKGPQGTLFGRNATGGVIQITTKAPSHTFHAEANASYANYATVHGDVFMTGPLSDNVAFSVSGAYTHQGSGWGKDYTTGHDTYKLDHQWSTRAKLLFEPGSDTAITLIGDYTDRFQHASSFQPYPGTTFNYEGKVGPTGTILHFGPVQSVYDTYSAQDNTLGFHGGGVSVTVAQTFEPLKIVSITAWRKGNGSYDFDTSSVTPAIQYGRAPNQRTESFSQELQFISNRHGSISWAAGGYYFWYSTDSLQNFRVRIAPIFGPSVTYTQGREVTESLAPFAQADWAFAAGTKLTLGARYTVEKRTLTGSFNPIANVADPVPGPMVPTQRSSVEKATYRAALSHDFTADISAYASFNTGFKSGGFNILSPKAPGYLPEELKAYEVGVKSQWFDRRLRLNLAGFYYDYTNIQVTQITPAGQIVVNGAKARIYGLDVDFQAQVTKGLHLNGGFELLSARFTKYPDAPANILFTGAGSIVGKADASGKRIALAQNFTATLGADYSVAAGFGTLDFNVTANYNGNYYFEPDNYLRQKSYTVLNASAKLTLPGDRISLTAWGRNLLDERVITQVNSQSGTGFPAVYGSAPLTYGLTAGVKF